MASFRDTQHSPQRFAADRHRENVKMLTMAPFFSLAVVSLLASCANSKSQLPESVISAMHVVDKDLSVVARRDINSSECEMSAAEGGREFQIVEGKFIPAAKGRQQVALLMKTSSRKESSAATDQDNGKEKVTLYLGWFDEDPSGKCRLAKMVSIGQDNYPIWHYLVVENPGVYEEWEGSGKAILEVSGVSIVIAATIIGSEK